MDKFKKLKPGTRFKFVDDDDWWEVESVGKGTLDSKLLYDGHGKRKFGDILWQLYITIGNNLLDS